MNGKWLGSGWNQKPIHGVLFATLVAVMFWPKRNKEAERFYLLPGMGGRAMRRKRRMMLLWGVGAGIFVSAALALALYFMNRPVR